MSKSLKEQFLEISKDFNEKFFNSDEPKICELHDILDNGNTHHNCISCNLSSNYELIKKHLDYNQHFEDLEYAYSSTILLYYLLVEKFFVIFGSIEQANLQPEGYKNSHSTMRKIWSWANFLKHPKAFMYVHEPKYLDVSKSSIKIDSNKVESKVLEDNEYLLHYEALIDDDFVEKYYMSKNNNIDLYNQLKNKTDVWVVFPNFIQINEGLKSEISAFEFLVKNNIIIKEHLHKDASILDFWDEEK
jgi:hypothetical protein